MNGVAHLWGLHHLDRDDVLGLHRRTQGSVAGLLPMLARHKAAQTLLPTGFAPVVVFDHFAREIFAHLDRVPQGVLLKMALLPKTTTSLAIERFSLAGRGERRSALEAYLCRLQRILGNDRVVAVTRRYGDPPHEPGHDTSGASSLRTVSRAYGSSFTLTVYIEHPQGRSAGDRTSYGERGPVVR